MIPSTQITNTEIYNCFSFKVIEPQSSVYTQKKTTETI